MDQRGSDMGGSGEGNGVPGAQAIRRAANLMRMVGERNPEGLPISELVERTGLKRPTVHRLLLALAEEGLVEQDPQTRKWRLGEETYILGTVAGTRHNIEAFARGTILKIAEQSGETAFFSIRTGMDVVALLREEGNFPIRTHVLRVGDRWPIGVGTASIAMLAAMPDSEALAVLDYNRSAFGRFPIYPSAGVWDLVQEARGKGYSVNRGLVVEGSWGLASAVLDAAGQPTMAVSVTGIESRLSGAREAEVGRLLIDQSLKLNELIRKFGRPAHRL